MLKVQKISWQHTKVILKEELQFIFVLLQMGITLLLIIFSKVNLGKPYKKTLTVIK